MEPRNLHQQHHHLHDEDEEIIGSSNSSLGSPCFSVGNNEHAWRNTPDFLLNNSNVHATCGESSPNSLNNSMIQNMGFPWPNNISIQSSSNHDQHLITTKIKQEQSPPNFSDILSPSSSTSTSLSEMLLLKTLSPTYKNHMLHNNGELNHQLSPFQPNNMHFPYHNNFPSSGGNSKIFPSVNISSLSSHNNNNNMSSSSSSSTMDMSNLQGGLDLFATSRFLDGGSLISQSSPNSHLLELFKGSSSFAIDHDLQQSSDLKLCNTSNHLSSFNNNGVPESSRPNCINVEPKPTHQMASKKPRFETRTACPPFKVRKEKLGDRIAALQQLVAPFGKTDTASVLMEAIGYIKFLQNQVETLSVPYMKLASQTKRNNNNAQRVFSHEDGKSEEEISDLRSRGLCLVPQSCMSFVASDADNGGVWPPPNFNHGF